MLKLVRLVRQELSTMRAAVPLLIGSVWCLRPLLNPETGWQPLPDLIYELLTFALLVSLSQRVRHTWRAPADKQ